MKQICKQCGKEFELSQSEIDFYNSKNLHLPKRCEACRQANKRKKGGSVQAYGNYNAQNDYRSSSNSRSALSIKFACAVLIIAILLAIGGTALTRIDFTNDYVSVNEPLYSQNVYIPETVDSESQASAETIQDAAEDSVDTVQSEVDASVDTVQSNPETPADAIQSEPEAPVEEIQGEADAAVEPEQEQVSVTPQYRFRNADLLNEHYLKHGVEMGFASKEEYQAAASAVVTNENALHKLEAEDGDDVYYLEASNEFVIVSTAGFIRTYFKPNDGIAYYNRQ